MKMRVHRCRSLVVISAVLTLLCQVSRSEAPPPGNPFGKGEQAPPAGDLGEQDDLLDPGNKNMGFENPQNGQPPAGQQNPTPNRPNQVPNLPPPPPPTARSQEPPIFPGQTTTQLPTNTTSNAKAKKSPRLADYLELDSSVKSLEVKNFDLPDKDIKDVVTLISKWTGKNFIVDQKLHGKITIMGPSQVTLQEAYEAFLSALEANGLTTVQAGKFIRIIESSQAKRAPVKTYSGDYAPKDDEFITRIIQLKYINADEVQREFRDLVTSAGKLFAYEPTNSIIITDTGSNIQRLKELMDTLDVKNYETTLHVLHIQHTGAKAIADMLAEIYGDDSSKPGQPRTFRKSALERTRGGGVITKILPDESTNSLVVLANQAGFDQLKQLVGKLDIKVTDTGKIHVYYCEYAKAEDLSQTLAALSGNSAGKSTRPGTTPTGTPGSTTPSTQNRPAGSSGPVTAELEGGVKITSDAATNALVITANAADYQTLKKVIKKLDIPRLQVFIESAIVEVQLGTNKEIGLDVAGGAPGRIFAGGFIGDAGSLQAALTNGTPLEGATIPIFAGPQYSVSNAPVGPNGAQVPVTVSTLMGLVHLLESTTQSTLLQTPQVIALDNEKAEFKVEDQTPVVSSVTAASPTSAPITNTDRLKTGVTMKITPHVNAASKQIRLELEEEVDNVRDSTQVPLALQSTNKATTSRVTNTTVVVRDLDYVMMGGLISDNVSENTTKVPLLGDIPILGWLFKSKTWNIIKSNLVIFLHPKIIGTTLASAEIVEQGLASHKKFVDKNFDGEDVNQDLIDELHSSVKEQKERGQNQPIFDYRNNNDDEVDKTKPQDHSQLGTTPGDSSEKQLSPIPDQAPPPSAQPQGAPIQAPPAQPAQDPNLLPPPSVDGGNQ